MNNSICVLQHGGTLTADFGADMQVSILNDGPVTIIIES